MTRTRVLVAGMLAVAAIAGISAIAWGLGRMSAPGPTFIVAAGHTPTPAVSGLPVAIATPPVQDPGQPVPTAGPPVLLSAAKDLPNESTTASGYRLTRAGVDPVSLARQLSAAFGILDEPRRSNEQVVVGDDPQVTVHIDPLVSWDFTDTGAAREAPVGRLPARQQAIDLASTLLGRLGVDLATIDWQVDRVDQGVRVTGWQLVAGQRSTLAWTVTVGRSGSVVAATGFAAGLQEVPGYRVVGAAFAVRRSGIAPWTALPPVPVSPATGPDPAAAAPPVVSGGRLQVGTREVLVTGAVLALAQYSQPDGNVLVLPSYRLTGSDGSVWSLVAVDGDAVSFGPAPSPTAS